MRSTRYAAILALVYLAVATAWIAVSSTIAAEASASVAELERLEIIKGVGFVAVTGLLVFLSGRTALMAMERSTRELGARERALIVNERRVFAGLIASTVAHDANNVLTVVLTDLGELDGKVDPELHARLTGSIDRLVELNRRLVSAGRLTLSGDLRPLELGKVVADAVDLMRRHPAVRDARLTLRADAGVSVVASDVLISQIVSNLVVNAAEATRGHGAVEVEVEARGAQAMIHVSDDGPGVPEHRRPGLFDALTTTKPGGNGVGLFSVKASAQALHGSVAVGAAPSGGARFTVCLPLADRPAGPPAPPLS